MPRTFTRPLPVPEYEMNAFGELRLSGIARLLQQIAIEASTDAGFSDAWYASAGTLWVIRRSTIEVRSPVRSGETLELSTHVADFRRVRSRREYEVRRASGGEVVAVAHTDWVYLERATGRLCRIPDEMMEAFLGGGEATSLPREPLVTPEPPQSAFVLERSVELREIDAMRHVNNAAWLDTIEETLVRALAARGWPLERLLETGRRLRPRLADVEYLREARYGEHLRSLLWPGAEPGEWLCLITRADDGAVLTRARTRWEPALPE